MVEMPTLSLDWKHVIMVLTVITIINIISSIISASPVLIQCNDAGSGAEAGG